MIFLLKMAMASDIQLANSYNGEFSVDIQGAGERAVIFVHDEGEDKRNFAALAEQMATESLITVNFDLIGHGERSSQPVVDPFMYMDIQTIIVDLQKKGVKDIQCLGVGLGGILCMQAISPQTPLTQIGIISPITTVRHQNLFSNYNAYPKYPLFVIAGNLDSISLAAILRLEEQRDVLLVNVDSATRGTRLLIETPQLELQLMDWIWGSSELMPKRLPIDIKQEVEVTGERLPF